MEKGTRCMPGPTRKLRAQVSYLGCRGEAKGRGSRQDEEGAHYLLLVNGPSPMPGVLAG